MTDPVTTWLDSAGRYPVLAEETVLLLTRQIQDPDTSADRRRRNIDKLVRHNMKLAATITLSFIKNQSKLRLSDDRVVDYLQQAAFGLIRAAEKFQPTKGYKFSTYANNWVRHYLQRYHYDQWSIIRVPEEVVRLAVKANKGGPTPTYKGRVNDAIAAHNLMDLDKPTTSGTEQLTLGEAVEYKEPVFYKMHNGTNLNTLYSAEAVASFGSPLINAEQEKSFTTWMQDNNYSEQEQTSILRTIHRVKKKHSLT
jgi:DNA-directed RNA polymerase sigma subunit (sigma70/sigma32)